MKFNELTVYLTEPKHKTKKMLKCFYEWIVKYEAASLIWAPNKSVDWGGEGVSVIGLSVSQP